MMCACLPVALMSLQIIQDINALKRLLRAAEMDYHALYRYITLCFFT